MLEPPRQHAVAAGGLVHDRRAVAQRGQHVDRRRHGVVGDAYARGGVLGDIAIGGDDGGHRLADVAHDRPGEQRLLGLDVSRQRRTRPYAIRRHERVVASDDANHAGRRRCRGAVHATQAGVSMLAAHEGDVQEAWQVDVGAVAAAARQEPAVLPAANGGAER